jgi:hypothetical protein
MRGEEDRAIGSSIPYSRLSFRYVLCPCIEMMNDYNYEFKMIFNF